MNPMKILLVDDSKSARYALRLQLQRHGATVETADSAESALQRIKEVAPDAVFMDHTMPGMNGFEALDILKSAPTTSTIPVVMCTSNEDPVFISQAHKKGALDILSKSNASDKLPDLLVRLERTITEPAVVQPPATAPTQAPPPAEGPAPVTPAEIADIARNEADRLLQEQLEERVRVLLDPRLADLRERLTAQVTAATDEADRLLQEQMEERLRVSLDPLLADLGERLTAQVAAATEESLMSRLAAETERLQKHVVQAQSEQAQLTANRIVNELLPKAIEQQLAQERPKLAHMVQGLIDASLDGLAEEPQLMAKILESAEASAARNAEELAKRQARDVAETVAAERVGEVTNRLIDSTGSSIRNLYLLVAGSALLGVASATTVYLLLR
ncbi:MAG: response regulator [Pseudomonadota bacterium]|nr:response regulator [Pseudomonadota bacterium]